MQLLLFKVALLGVSDIPLTFSLGAIVSVIASITKSPPFYSLIVKKIADRLGIGLPSRINLISKAVGLLSRAFMFLSRQAIPLLIRGILTMSAALLTNPLTWIIVLIGAVALAIYRYWGPIKAFFKGFWSGLQMGLSPLIDTLTYLI